MITNAPVTNIVTSAVQIPLQIDPRIKRMVRLALRTYKVIVLVGPPGTGKTVLIDELVEEAQANPGEYGLTAPPAALMRRTPEESWTARELVGGETVDDKGRLRFRPGAVLDAIRTNRWLLLDELNRADMDKIFGPLMTWLGGQSVELGRASSAIDAPQVELHWGDSAACSCDGLERLASDSIGSAPIVFAAGVEWRLLATYNPLDAARVFRFGQALGRRLKEIPIPAASAADFRAVLHLRAPLLPPHARESLCSMYAAHLADPVTQLGPAVFFDMIDYVLNGVSSEFLGGLDEGIADGEGSHGLSSVDGESSALASPAVESAAITAVVAASPSHALHFAPLLAEAYLMSPGKYVSKLPPASIQKLGQRIVEADALPEDEWSWIKRSLAGLA